MLTDLDIDRIFIVVFFFAMVCTFLGACLMEIWAQRRRVEKWKRSRR